MLLLSFLEASRSSCGWLCICDGRQTYTVEDSKLVALDKIPVCCVFLNFLRRENVSMARYLVSYLVA